MVEHQSDFLFVTHAESDFFLSFAGDMKKSSFDTLVIALVVLLALHMIGKGHKEIRQETVPTEQTMENDGSQTGDGGSYGYGDEAEYADADFDGDGSEAGGNMDEMEGTQGLEIPRSSLTTILRRTGYTTAYDEQRRCPQWTAWHLTASHTTGPFKRKGVKYQEDDDVDFPKATNADYSGSGYDRGHMCPSGDNKWSREAQEDCFLFTNMCPQSHELNGGDWNDLEMKCRKWAEKYGDRYIACGPVYSSQNPKTIGRNKVAVPDGFYKVVLCMRGEPKAIGFYYDNDDGHAPMHAYVRTVDEVERLTGIDFFCNLNDEVERRVEAHADLDDW